MTSSNQLKQVASFERKDATHKFMCRHAIGRNGFNYWMYCIPLGKTTKSGKVKCLVFGDRNWKDTDHIKRIRYIDKHRLEVKPNSSHD